MPPLDHFPKDWSLPESQDGAIHPEPRRVEGGNKRIVRRLGFQGALLPPLRPYVFDRDRPPGRLLFPSYRTGQEQMITDIRKVLDRVAVRAGWQKGEIRSKMFRHTYCAARLQTLDGGQPVSPYTVSRELGHGSRDMVERVYAHLGTMRHRSEVVEYRIEQDQEAHLGQFL